MKNINGVSTARVRRDILERCSEYTKVRFSDTQNFTDRPIRIDCYLASPPSGKGYWIFFANFDSLKVEDGKLYCDDYPIKIENRGEVE